MFIGSSQFCTEMQREIEKKKVYKLCKNTGAVLLQTLDPPSDESDIENDLPDTMLDIAISVQNCEDPINMFETKIITAHTDDTINTIDVAIFVPVIEISQCE
jgi:hypothetical protein